MKNILVTGGAGYIGSHTTLALLELGLRVVVVDNLCNSSLEVFKRIKQIAGREAIFVLGDVRDSALIRRVLDEYSIEAVLHFAGLKSVSESITQPLNYFDNNVSGTQVLLQACADAGIFKLIFSSSATVYGNPSQIPISETCPIGQPTNPYGRSKLMVEGILHDVSASDPRWRIAILRYFNPVGAHESGLIGEDPNGVPSNLLPFIAQVAIGRLPELVVFGGDYLTPDGTGVRDFIHVMDLVGGHLKALEVLQTQTGTHVWNLGTGQGYSVFEIIRAFERASEKSVPYRIAPRRPGDIGICYADPTKAEHELDWKANRGLEQMMEDAWRWQRMNPNGFNC